MDHGNGADMQVANEIRLRGTPTFIWRNRDGSEGRLEGVANDFGALIAELNPHKPGRPSDCYHTHMMSTLRLVLSVDVQACDQHNVKHASDGLWSLLDRLEPDAGQPRLGCREAAVPELAAIIAKRRRLLADAAAARAWAEQETETRGEATAGADSESERIVADARKTAEARRSSRRNALAVVIRGSKDARRSALAAGKQNAKMQIVGGHACDRRFSRL